MMGAPAAFTTALRPIDACGAYWMGRAVLRLRREICWLWQERTGAPQAGMLPPLGSRAVESLDLLRFAQDKALFEENDPAAKYLSDLIAEPEPEWGAAARGSFTWVVRELGLTPVERLALGIAVLASVDGAAGPVIATCQNDAARVLPSLALLQKLWDRPEDVLQLANPSHALFRFGLLRRSEAMEWDAPLHCPEVVVLRLLYSELEVESVLRHLPLAPRLASLNEAAERLAVRFVIAPQELRVIPLAASDGRSAAGLLGNVTELTGRKIRCMEEPASNIAAALTLAWLDDADLAILGDSPEKLGAQIAPALGVPTRLFVRQHDRGSFDGIPPRHRESAAEVPALRYEERLSLWQMELGGLVAADTLAETSRRFRFDAETICDVGATLRRSSCPVTREALTTACRLARAVDLGDLAQHVTPRFASMDELFLPQAQKDHLLEVLHAMRAVTEVHYQWGTARVWNESGMPVLFYGPPGTGKTMAAEILASELELPMYRIDLSQVVNKYIGETEKNLKRIFDAADTCDTVLLFDEADSIFGKRMEARDAHDRWANLEVSYLLERMERFKGLGVLCTNRKKDLDEAFARRLRYIVEFPLPGVEQRRSIWEQSIPKGVDKSSIDLDLLATNFPIAGGHIRSAVFNACLQSARGGPPKLEMEQLVVALKRELDKINRPMALDLFGAWEPVARRLEREADDSH